MEGLLFDLSKETISDLDTFKHNFKVALGRDALNSPVSGAFVAICIKASASSGYYRQFIYPAGSGSIYSRYAQFIGDNIKDKGDWIRIGSIE